MTHIDRRDFIKGCTVATLAAGASSNALAYFAPPDYAPTAATNDTLVVVFLRGAMDGLSLLPPGAGSPYRADYDSARKNAAQGGTGIPTTGTGAALALNGTTWALHPRASGLRTLFNQNRLAFIVAAGQAQPNPVIRSHFDAQANLEFGFGGGTGNNIGWLTRHLASGGLPAMVPLPATSLGNITAASLLGTEWTRPYSRELGAFPLSSLKAGKYWPPISRVDNVYGDRNLMCSCPPVAAYAS